MSSIPLKSIRWLSYPFIFGATALAQLALVSSTWPYWPLGPFIAGLGILMVACLEQLQPYQPQWNVDQDDTAVDILHAVFSLSLIFFSVNIAHHLRAVLFTHAALPEVWSAIWPMWCKVLLAGLIIDFGLWFMHWISHKVNWLWRLHALHHSSTRLYWLNGERRHPVSAVLLAGPGLVAAVLLGAPAAAIGCWYSIIAVHLAFQHANLDYRLGIFRHVVGVAEVHRWHHKRDFEDAQVNFGEFWMIWDKLFGTYHDADTRLDATEVGIREFMPSRYLAQLRWPFRRQSSAVKAK